MLELFLFLPKYAKQPLFIPTLSFSQAILLAYVLGIEPRKWRARAGSFPSTVVPLMLRITFQMDKELFI